MSTDLVPNSPAQSARLRARAARGAVGALAHSSTTLLEVRGDLPPGVLQAGLDYLTARHPALRAAFDRGHDHHQLRPAGQIPQDRRVVRGADPAARWQTALADGEAEAMRPFEPDQPPLARASLLSTEWDRHLLVLAFDHLIMDAWSAMIIVRDFVAGADAATLGRALVAEPSPAYAAARRSSADWARTEQAAAAMRDYDQLLAGYQDRLPLSAEPDVAEPGVVTGAVHLPQRVVDALTERAVAFQGGLFAVVLAAFAATIAGEITGPTLVYTTFAGREGRSDEMAVGSLSNHLELGLPPVDLPVADFVRQARGGLIDAVRVQRKPSTRLASAPYGQTTDRHLTASVQLLPGLITGAEQPPARVGSATVSHRGLTMCPTGADLDLFVAEEPVRAAGSRKALVLMGMTAAERVGQAQLDRVLAGWAAGCAVLADRSWAGLSLCQVADRVTAE